MQRLRHQVNQNHDLENQRLLKEFIQGASNRFHQERLQQDKYYIPVLFLINHFYIVKKQLCIRGNLVICDSKYCRGNDSQAGNTCIVYPL